MFSNANLFFPVIFCKRSDADICIFWRTQIVLQLVDLNLDTFCSKVIRHFVENHSFACSPRRAVIFRLNRHSAGGSFGGPGNVGRICKGVPSGGGGALPRMHSDTAL